VEGLDPAAGRDQRPQPAAVEPQRAEGVVEEPDLQPRPGGVGEEVEEAAAGGVVADDVVLGPDRAAGTAERKAPKWFAILLWLLAAAGIIGGAAYAANDYARSQAYLIAEGGRVVVYQGVPGSIVGVSLHWRTEETTLTVSSLDPVTASRLEEGVRVDGLAEAESLLDAYRSRAALEATTTPSP
jgi:protein phosphatase